MVSVLLQNYLTETVDVLIATAIEHKEKSSDERKLLLHDAIQSSCVIKPTPTSIPGLVIYKNFLTLEKSRMLFDTIDKYPWNTELSRRTQHYGYKYTYTRPNLIEKTTKMPKILEDIADSLHENKIVGSPLNQCIVNEYEPGQCIGAHTDSPIFGEYICSISLGSNIEMEFSRGDHITKVLLNIGSLIVLSGEARH